MEGTDRANTPYEVDSNIDPPSQLLFTKEAADSAQQVVSLRESATIRKLKQVWTFVGLNRQRRLSALLVVFALAGGVTGGLLAAAQRGETEQEFDRSLSRAGVDATTEADAAPRRAGASSENRPDSNVDIDSSKADYDLDDANEALDRIAAESRKRRSSSRRKAYMFGVIAGDGREFDEDGKDKRGRKNRYWDDEEP